MEPKCAPLDILVTLVEFYEPLLPRQVWTVGGYFDEPGLSAAEVRITVLAQYKLRLPFKKTFHKPASVIKG